MVCTRTTVEANIVRPQRDQSLRKKRPRTHLTAVWEHTVLPYGIAIENEFTNSTLRHYVNPIYEKGRALMRFSA